MLLAEASRSGTFEPHSAVRMVSMEKQVIRFGVGSPDKPYASTWRLWANGSDTYLAARTIAGIFKISLHKSGEWISAFTEQSGLTLQVDNNTSRRHTAWRKPPEFRKGWTQGPSIVVPWVPWAGELRQIEKVKPDMSWYPVPAKNNELFLTLLISEPETGSDISKVLINGDMLEQKTISLANGQRVWLYGREIPIRPEDREHLRWLDKEFRVFTFNGEPAGLSTVTGLEVFKDIPVLIQMPLGLRHFTFKPK